ncbi:MAG TPA: hypothetical protein VNX86_15235 [Rhizomicrobium sp.]|jgi:hypothetical protein|nr:hypothetical protein [Rhizomicrobium sp.]
MRHIVLVGCLTAMLVESAVAAADFVPPPMPAGYNDPGPELPDLLPQIAAALRSNLNDPYSVRDFSLCQSHIMPAQAPGGPEDSWQPSVRVQLFQLNAKNEFGGYAGKQDGIATFQKGKLQRIRTYSTIDGATDMEQHAIAWREPCHPIPDAEIQKLISEVR